MKIPRLLLPSLILVATLLGCEAVLAQEKTAPKKADLDAETKALIQKTEKGDATSQLQLGRLYAEGLGVAKDAVEAVKWYRKAADQGLAHAQHNLGARYADGRGVPKDEVEAYKWYLLAEAQGDEQAKKSIADIEKDLTPAQRAEGERLAREWKPKK